MRVLQITAFSGWGCTGRIALGIHNALVADGNESAIAWGRTNTAPKSVKTIQIGSHFDQQVHGLYTRMTDKCGFGSKNATKLFIKQIKELKPDLIQMHIMHGYYINLEILFDYIKSENIPVVWTFHDCWAFTGHCPYFDLVGCEKWKTGCHNCQQKGHHPISWFMDNSKWNWNKKKEVYGAYDKLTIVTPSKWLASLVKDSFLHERNVVVINNGININNFKPTKNKIKEKLGIQDKKIILGVSSSWADSKGLSDFVSLSELLEDNYQIVLVGLTKKQKDKLPKSIIGIERTDSVQELAELYTAADVFVNPTYEDNYPTTNLEALACGTPVITYKSGGSTEIVDSTGYGYIVEQGNIELLKNIIIRQIVEPGIVDYKSVISYVDETEKFRDYIYLYKQIL